VVEAEASLRDKRGLLFSKVVNKGSGNTATEEPISHKSVQRHQKRIYNDRYDKH
jgi:hypothetical protein